MRGKRYVTREELQGGKKQHKAEMGCKGEPFGWSRVIDSKAKRMCVATAKAAEKTA